jgi:hypothetical protein
MHTLIQRPLVLSRADRLGSGQGTSDETLLGAIAAGDQRAMQVLYARHHVRVYRFVLRLPWSPPSGLARRHFIGIFAFSRSRYQWPLNWRSGPC